MSITELVTHDGRFHADDVLSASILKGLYPDAKIFRTREKSFITPAPQRIIFDVGGEYSPGQQIFDHHQPLAPKRDDGAPYSSIGLVWKYFGRKWLETKGTAVMDLDPIHQMFDRDIFRAIDMLDNGVSPGAGAQVISGIALPALIEDFMPTYEEVAADKMGFDMAVFFAQRLLGTRLKHYKAERRAHFVLTSAISRNGSDRVLELEAEMPWRNALKSPAAQHIIYVLHPRTGGEWCVVGVPTYRDEFEVRHPLPSDWAGLEGEALQLQTGVKDAVFCHNARFMAVAKTREGARKLARSSLANAGASILRYEMAAEEAPVVEQPLAAEKAIADRAYRGFSFVTPRGFSSRKA